MKTTSLAALALAFAGCTTNTSGNVGASKLGDTGNPAERGSPLTELQQACTAPGELLPAASAIRRAPYLQQVTATSAIVGWVTTAIDQAVEITRPDGSSVASARAEPERGTVRNADETQVWARSGELEPDTMYCYRVMAGEEPLSERIGFRTAPAPDSTRPIGILAFGDSGSKGGDQLALRAQMESVPYQVMIHTGDLAYDDGTIQQLEDTVFDVYEALFRHVPFFPAAGNHDYHTANGVPFRDVFQLPENGSEEKWYSYDWGRVHFVALDTEADYATQAAWLDGDLAATSLPWKIVYLHRPPYSSGEHGSDSGLRKALAPILEKHGVQLVLAGHDHNYERTTPQNGVTYVVTGGGGRGTRPVGASNFTAFSESVIHFVYVEVRADELVLHAIDARGTEFDSAIVPRRAG